LIPATVEMTETAAFKIAMDSNLVSLLKMQIIRQSARGLSRTVFAEIPFFSLSVEVIGENCFHKCVSRHRLRFVSDESLRRFVYDSSLVDSLKQIALDEMSKVFQIEVGDEGLYSWVIKLETP
jgi:hypothetical protein